MTVKTCLSRWFVLAVVFALQGVSGLIVSAQQPERIRPPEAGPPPMLKLPPVQRASLSNGIPLVLMEKHGVPLVQVMGVFRAGTETEDADRPGLASLTAAMLTEGAGGRDALTYADAVDFLGAEISADADRHMITLDLHAPVSVLDEALRLWADAATRPNLDPVELDRLRKERLTSLAQFHDQPRTIASTAIQQMLFGPRHPYGTMMLGTEAALRSFTRQDVSDFHRRSLQPSSCTIVIAGDITMDAARKKLEPLLGSWKGGGTTSPSVPASRQVQERVLYLIDKPGAAQSEIRIGRIGASRNSKDYYPLVVMNTILGGSFSSRLNQNLRERNGYTYGARSWFQFLPQPGPFIAAAAVQTDVTAPALKEFFNELRAIVASVSEEEMTRARNYVAFGYPSNFETVADIARALRDMTAFGLPAGYFNEFIGNILAVTREDVLRVARDYIDPERVAVVVVGDRSKIEAGLQSLQFGPVKIMSVADVLGTPPETGRQ